MLRAKECQVIRKEFVIQAEPFNESKSERKAPTERVMF